MRYNYHFFVGLALSIAWFIFAFPSEDCWGSANTTEFWAGALLIVTFLATRIARYAKFEWPKDCAKGESLAESCSPFLCELACYSVAALLMGDTDTLTLSNSKVAPLILGSLLVCLLLALPCAWALGRKLVNTNLPVWVPIITAASGCVMAVPASFRLNEDLLPRSFPLIPLVVIALGGVSFLLLSPCFSDDWLEKPHIALTLACFFPAAPLLLALAFFLDGIGPGSAAAICAIALALLAAVPVYLALWLLPIRPDHILSLLCCCAVIGLLTSYNVFHIAEVMFCLEEADTLQEDIFPYQLIGGGLSLAAPFCVKIRESIEIQKL